MPKVHIVQPNYEYRQMFEQYGWEVLSNPVDGIPDLVCFTGGEDVNPKYYGEQRHPQTFHNTERDEREKHTFNSCVEASIPMVGICRGGQFLNVMNGGRMYQHVSNHTMNHLIHDLHTKEQVLATSTHHQMMRPGIGGQCVAVAYECKRKEFMHNGAIVVQDAEEWDYEVVFYPHTQSICFQPHPEFGTPKLQDYFFSVVKRYLEL